MRWGKTTANYVGSLHLACACITFVCAGLLDSLLGFAWSRGTPFPISDVASGTQNLKPAVSGVVMP